MRKNKQPHEQRKRSKGNKRRGRPKKKKGLRIDENAFILAARLEYLRESQALESLDNDAVKKHQVDVKSRLPDWVDASGDDYLSCEKCNVFCLSIGLVV